MKITNMDFSAEDVASVRWKANYSLTLRDAEFAGLSKEAQSAYLDSLTPQNLVRAALGLPLRARGGIRAGGFEPGNQHANALRRNRK